MDPTRDILYRSFLLNDSAIRSNIDPDTGVGKGITGCVIDSWNFSDVDIVQFLEKRPVSDGMDAGDVYQGARRLRMAGTLYGKTRGALFDLYWEWRKTMSPVLAQRESPGDKGFLPLYFAVPTEDTDNFVSGQRDLFIYARPGPQDCDFDRDRQGGVDTDSLAVPWSATMLQKDPAIYGADAVDVDLSAGGTISGDFVNRGNYLSPLHMLLVVDNAAGSIAVQAGGSTFTLTLPASTGSRIVRYKGDQKIVTVEENSVELLRMDVLPGVASMEHPQIPEGTSPYVVTFTGVTPTTGSHQWFWESLA